VLALVLVNIPIAVALGVVALVAMVTTHGTAILPNLALVTYNGATSFPLLAIPLFILAGAIMNASGISRRLIAFASSLFGWIRGGLAHVSIGSSMFFAEISGSAVADVAALGSILIPGMKARGYPAPLAAAVMSSAATLAVIIPPSIPMILYAVMAETSVVQLFVAGIVPGIIGGFGLMGMASWFARRYDLPREEAFAWSRVRSTARDALWAFLLPIIILGGIFGGVVTATEGAALAVVAALLVGLVIYRELDSPPPAQDHHRRRRPDRRRHAAGRDERAARHLPDRGAGAAGARARHHRADEQQVARARAAQLPVPAARHVPALGRRDHPGGAGRHAAGARGRHRPGPLRPDRDDQPRHRPADAPGRERAHGRLLDREGVGVGGDAGQRLVHRRAARRAALVTYVPVTGMGLVELFYR
jgi:hypothetical protein